MIKKLLIAIVLIGIGFAALQIPFSVLIGGADQHFSFFDFLAPALGGFIGSIIGAVSVIGIKAVNALAHQETFDTVTIIRLFPLAFAALYFGLKKYKPVMALVPLLSIMLFNLHPEGRGAWYYSLYWLIPLAALFVKRSLVMNSLGATFSAHAVGSVAFLYAFNLPSEAWIALIPIVFIERMIFTSGIAVTYLAGNTALAFIADKMPLGILKRFVEPSYVLSRTFFKKFV